MSRVLPSQVVQVIEDWFPQILIEAEGFECGADPESVQIEWREAKRVQALVELVDHVSPELISVEPKRYGRFTMALSVARRFPVGEPTLLESLSPLHSTDDRELALNPLTILYRTLRDCPDEVPSEATARLTFVEDERLRQSLRLDLSEANRSLTEGQWKAATVLGGAVVEALLLFALVSRVGDKKAREAARKLSRKKESTFSGRVGPLVKWTLAQLIEMAAAQDLIGEATAAQATLAQGFRNLIHPGREQRTGQRCDRGTALAALAAVERAVLDLEQGASANHPGADPL